MEYGLELIHCVRVCCYWGFQQFIYAAIICMPGYYFVSTACSWSIASYKLLHLKDNNQGTWFYTTVTKYWKYVYWWTAIVFKIITISADLFDNKIWIHMHNTVLRLDVYCFWKIKEQCSISSMQVICLANTFLDCLSWHIDAIHAYRLLLYKSTSIIFVQWLLCRQLHVFGPEMSCFILPFDSCRLWNSNQPSQWPS